MRLTSADTDFVSMTVVVDVVIVVDVVVVVVDDDESASNNGNNDVFVAAVLDAVGFDLRCCSTPS